MTQASESSSHAPVVPRCVLLVGESSAVPSSLVGALDRRGLEIVIVRQPPQVMLELAPGNMNSTRGNLNSPPGNLNSAPGSDPAGAEASPSITANPAADPPAPDAQPDDDHPPAPSLSVVVVEPQQQPRIGELRAAVAAYYPAVRCWQYHAHGPEGHASLESLEPSPQHLSPAAETTGAASPASGMTRRQDFVDVDVPRAHTSEHDPPSPAGDTARVKGASQRLRSLVVQIDDPQPVDDGPLVSEEELAMLLGPDPLPAPGRTTGGHPPADPQATLGISPDSRHPDGERE